LLCYLFSVVGLSILEIVAPVFMVLVYVRFVAELIGAIGQMGEIPLVVLAVFLECDFRTDLEKWWKEMRSVRDVHHGLRDKCWH
jgi:hypothetical protein